MRRQPKYVKSVDANQKEIVRRLNEFPGVKCIVIGGPVDLLIGYRAKNFLVEVKDSNKKKYDQRYTIKQLDFLKDWPGQVRVCETFEEIMKLVIGAYQERG